MAVEPRPDSPSPPRPAWASPAQLAPGGRRCRRAPSSTRPAASPRGRPRLLRAFGLPAGNQAGGGREGGSADPETPNKEQEGSPAGTDLIWAAPYLERPNMALPLPALGGGVRGVGAGAGWELQAPGPGGHRYCFDTRLSQSLCVRDAGAGLRVEVPTALGWGVLNVTPGPPGRSFHIRASCFPYMAMYVTAEAGPCRSRPLK